MFDGLMIREHLSEQYFCLGELGTKVLQHTGQAIAFLVFQRAVVIHTEYREECSFSQSKR